MCDVHRGEAQALRFGEEWSRHPSAGRPSSIRSKMRYSYRAERGRFCLVHGRGEGCGDALADEPDEVAVARLARGAAALSAASRGVRDFEVDSGERHLDGSGDPEHLGVRRMAVVGSSPSRSSKSATIASSCEEGPARTSVPTLMLRSSGICAGSARAGPSSARARPRRRWARTGRRRHGGSRRRSRLRLGCAAGTGRRDARER